MSIVGYGAYRSVTLIGAASSLQISHMTVRGHERLSTGEVLALVDGLRGQNILSVSLDQWQTRLLSSPWVESATIRRVLPSTVEIVGSRTAADGDRPPRLGDVSDRRQGRADR